MVAEPVGSTAASAHKLRHRGWGLSSSSARCARAGDNPGKWFAALEARAEDTGDDDDDDDRLEAKLDRLEAKVDKLGGGGVPEAKLDKLEAKLDRVEAKVNDLGDLTNQLQSLEAKLDTPPTHDELEAKLDNICFAHFGVPCLELPGLPNP